MFLKVNHAIYIIIVFTVIVQSYITSTSLHPGLSRAKTEKVTVHAGVLLSDATALSSPQSPDVVLGERMLRMLISCPECHIIPLTRSVFMFGTIKDTPSIIRTGCKRIYIYGQSSPISQGCYSLWAELSGMYEPSCPLRAELSRG